MKLILKGISVMINSKLIEKSTDTLESKPCIYSDGVIPSREIWSVSYKPTNVTT